MRGKERVFWKWLTCATGRKWFKEKRRKKFRRVRNKRNFLKVKPKTAGEICRVGRNNKEWVEAKMIGVVVLALDDDEVGPLLLSLNTRRGSWANTDRSETARRLTLSIPMVPHKTRSLGGPWPPLASSTLVRPIINKACLNSNALSSIRILKLFLKTHFLIP